ncbi:hypothetical protein L195_g055961, partial [Trifolium pratense]
DATDTDEDVHSQVSTPPNSPDTHSPVIDHIGTSTSNLNNQGRNRRPPPWHADYDTTMTEEETGEEDSMNLMTVTPCLSNDPATYEEAVKSSTWKAAMDKEIEAIERNGTWKLTDLPRSAKVIGVKWIYKTKLNERGEIEKYKARLVAKGYAQRYGTDYKEVFAPVARWDTIRSLLAIAASRGWDVFQLDVKSAFLHGELKETVYVEQPAGYVKAGREKQVYQLHKALYGLKQAPRAWYSKIEAYFIKE